MERIGGFKAEPLAARREAALIALSLKQLEGGCQAGMRLDYKTSAHSENCLVLTNRIVKKDLFFTIVRTSGQSAAWIGSAHEESDAHKCRDRFEAPQNRHRLA